MSDNKKNLLSAQEICEILRECGNSGVSELSYMGLKVTLRDPAPQTPPTTEVFEAWETPGPLSQQPSQTREATVEDQAHAIERELDELLITDPLEYERLIRSGDLVNEGT